MLFIHVYYKTEVEDYSKVSQQNVICLMKYRYSFFCSFDVLFTDFYNDIILLYFNHCERSEAKGAPSTVIWEKTTA